MSFVDVSASPFRWPEGYRAALSMTFDDARPSQLDLGLPEMDAFGVKATFYVTPANVALRVGDWRSAVRNGHEIGNHTVSHPCSGNFMFSRHNPLEEYTLERMEGELTGANNVLEEMLGVTPQTFAYPCGQKFVGQGEALRSTVPLVAKHFIAGRGFRDESANDPARCDLAQLMGHEADGLTWDGLYAVIQSTLRQGGWLVLAAHDVGEPAFQTLDTATLSTLCYYANCGQEGLWVDTVQAVAAYVRSEREAM